ncbi:hypothetical protein UlMin_038640 [Ulmus minor]
MIVLVTSFFWQSKTFLRQTMPFPYFSACLLPLFYPSFSALIVFSLWDWRGEFSAVCQWTIHNFYREYGDSVQVDGFDIDYGFFAKWSVIWHNDVLTIKLGNLGTDVLNKQIRHKKKIWLASLESGASRFDWDCNAEAWFYRQTKAILLKVLESELDQLCGESI